MARCPGCGADVTHAVTEGGENVPLERWTDTMGPERYRIVKFGPPDTVAVLAESSPVQGYPDHRLDCPAHENGRRAYL